MKNKLLLIISLFVIVMSSFTLALDTGGLIQYFNLDSGTLNGTVLSSQKGNNGTFNGTQVNGKFGFGGRLNVVSDYLNTSSLWDNIYEKNFSLNFWINTTDTSGYIFQLQSTPFNFSIGTVTATLIDVYANGTTGNNWIRLGSSGVPASLNSGKWTMFTLTKTGGKQNNYTFYKNGTALTVTNNGANTIPFDDTGYYNNWLQSILFGGTDFIGSIDEISVWNNTLTASEVSELYAGWTITQNASCIVCNQTCSPCGGGCTATDISYMFLLNNVSLAGNITGWNTSCITDMTGTFYNSNFDQPIGNWDVSNVINMAYMFYNSNFNQSIESWDVRNVKNMEYMFSNSVKFNQPIGSWNVSNVTNMARMFTNSVLFNQPIGNWNTGKVNNMSYMLYNTGFNQSISNWNTSNVIDMSAMFGQTIFNNNISNWDTSKVYNMHGMFLNTSFNLPISNWDTSKVSDMGLMFYESDFFNQPLNSWNTSSVITMEGMFYNAFFNQPISNWNTGKVNDMSVMFYKAINFNQPLNSWNTSSVITMEGMFYNATNFNQNIGSWNIGEVTDMGLMFSGVTLSLNNYDALLNGWANQTIKTFVNFNGGNSKYTILGENARNNTLIGIYNWTITDGGKYIIPVTFSARISPNLSYINTTLKGYCNVSYFDNITFNINYTWYKNQKISCYQESANTINQTGIDGNCILNYSGDYAQESNLTTDDEGYFYVNYTKPIGAIDGSIWKVEHGDIPYSAVEYNITLNNSCLNAYNNKIVLRIISNYINHFSQPQCFNGSNWINIGNYIDTAGAGSSILNNNSFYFTKDGNWNSGAQWCPLAWGWNWTGFAGGVGKSCGSFASLINEEAMYWSINNITSVTNGTYINGTNYGETNVNNHTLNNSDYGYDYFLSCNGYNNNSAGNTVYSSEQRVNDLITYSNSTNDSTSVFPQIGDVINLYVNITNRDYTGTCKLVVNDTGTWRYPTNYINTILVDTTNVSSYSLPFTFYITTNSTISRNNISWRVECNDTHNTTFASNVSVFTVRDVTYPAINITANSFNINTNNVSIISGVLYNFMYNITYNDPNLFAMEVNVTCSKNGTIYYFTNVSLNPVQTYNKYDNVTLNNISVQNCTFFTAVSDDHTAKEIPLYQSEQLSNGISYLTENNNLIQITAETQNTVLLSKQISGTVIETGGIKGEGTIKEDGGTVDINTYTSIQTEKLVDRETFKFNYDDYSTTRQFIVRADNPIYYIEGSKYPAHFVVWNAEEFKGNWIDFSDTINQGNEYTVEKINDYQYAVTIITNQPQNTLQFSSIGGTLITNFSFTFYIGGTIFLNSNNTVNGTPFTNYSYNLQYIDSFPPMNSTGTVPSNNASIQNISEGNYTLFLTHTCFFPQTTTVNVNNLSINISYDSYQSERLLLFKHVQTLLPLTNITYNITGIGTNIDGNTGTSSNLTLHLNAGIYNISWTTPGYSNMSQNITTTCLENTTTILYTSYLATFNLFDEKLSTLTGSNVVFNLSGATSVSFLLFCPGITLSEIVNSTNFTTTISCPYLSFQFLLSYGTTSYYRSFILDPSLTNDYPIYLIDQLTTAYLFNGLVADDLLNKYIRPRIFVLKTIGNRTVQITADFADIEQKIGAFLIENHKYIIQILSDNLPIYTIGDYAADLSGTKNIRLYQVGLYDPASGGNETILGNFFVLNLTQDNSTIRFRYKDDRGNTTSTLFKVYQNNTLICSLLTLNNNNLVSDCPITGYNRSVVRVEVTQTVDGVTTTWSRILHDITEIGLSILQYFGQTQFNWFIIVIIASLALFGTIQTTNIYMVALLGIAILFNVFGWLTIATSVLAFTAMVAMIAIFKEGDKSN